MDEKIFDLLSKMYNEVQEIKGEMQGMKGEMQGMKEDMATKKDIVRLENTLDEKLSALFDGYTQNTSKLERVDYKMDKLTDNYEKQDVEIKVIHSRAK